MSNGNRSQRNRGNQQRRSSGRGRPRQQAPKGPAMTALGESTYEAVFDHGTDGYGIWFDGIVREDPMYRQHWKGLGLRPIYVKIEEDRIVISREIDRPMPGGQQFDAESLTGDEMHMDISLGDITGESEEAPVDIEGGSTTNPTDEQAQVYTPEEAARLFVTSSESDSPEAEADTVVEAEVKPKRRTTTRRRTPKAAAAETTEDDATS